MYSTRAMVALRYQLLKFRLVWGVSWGFEQGEYFSVCIECLVVSQILCKNLKHFGFDGIERVIPALFQSFFRTFSNYQMPLFYKDF